MNNIDIEAKLTEILSHGITSGIGSRDEATK